MRLASLSSGSSGNCIYVGNDNTHILIDAGVSYKTIEAGLNELDLTIDDINAVLITHEHSDHIKGLGVLLRKRFIPVYASMGSIQGIYDTNLGRIDYDCLHSIREIEDFYINDICVTPHEISHDANEPLCFSFSYDSKKCAVVTDLGKYDDDLIHNFENLDSVLVEANHDVRMLEMGPYPYSLKRRILSDKGHLSNEACGRFVSRILHDDMKAIMLGHLSEQNNLPDLAYEAVRLEITMAPNKYDGLDFPILVAKRNKISNIITF